MLLLLLPLPPQSCDGNLAQVAWQEAIVDVAKVLLLLLIPLPHYSLQVLDSTPPEQMAAVTGGMADGEVPD